MWPANKSSLNERIILSYDEEEMMKRYFEQLEREKESELARNSGEIEHFKKFCKSFDVDLSEDNFDYIQTTPDSQLLKKT